MNITVCIKQVPDTETRVRIKEGALDCTGIRWILPPYDEIAVEAALRLKEKHPNSSVTVLSAGPPRVADSIRAALALGADHGVRIDLPESSDAAMTAKALAAYLKKQPFMDVVLFGKESLDLTQGQVPWALSVLLERPCVTSIFELENSGSKFLCKREGDDGTIETIEVSVPLLLTVQKGLNLPRCATLPNTMKARKKEIQTFSPTDHGVSEADRRCHLKNLELAPSRTATKKLPGSIKEQAQELLRILIEQEQVL